MKSVTVHSFPITTLTYQWNTYVLASSRKFSGVFTYQGVRNNSFSENLVYALNEWFWEEYVTFAEHLDYVGSYLFW